MRSLFATTATRGIGSFAGGESIAQRPSRSNHLPWRAPDKLDVVIDPVGTERLRAALDLAEAGVAVMRQNLRRAHPDAPAEHIEQLLRKWIGRRPGAEKGDCPGPPRRLREG